MTKDKSRTTGSPTFRKEEKKRLSDGPKESGSNEDSLSFLRELTIRQIQLEMQNEELQRTQLKAEKAKETFLG